MLRWLATDRQSRVSPFHGHGFVSLCADRKYSANPGIMSGSARAWLADKRRNAPGRTKLKRSVVRSSCFCGSIFMFGEGSVGSQSTVGQAMPQSSVLPEQQLIATQGKSHKPTAKLSFPKQLTSEIAVSGGACFVQLRHTQLNSKSPTPHPEEFLAQVEVPARSHLSFRKLWSLGRSLRSLSMENLSVREGLRWELNPTVGPLSPRPSPSRAQFNCYTIGMQ